MKKKHQEIINGLFGFLCFGLIFTHCFLSFCRVFDNRYSNRYRRLEDLRIREENNRLRLIIEEKKKYIKKKQKYKNMIHHY